MTFPLDYAERIYAGILGKIIGVYLGRPFEGWTYEKILADLGEIKYFVNERHDLPLRNRQVVVTDDDISGTFTFLRALPDYGNTLNLTPAQIGQTWLNYIIEDRTILWWGGLGNSTEHTAFLRLKDGIPAPESGSITRNSKVVAEQIGSQIFIDGWGLIAPGDPALAANLARRAASVSHDGEAIYGAQIVAALVAEAFTEPDIDQLLDTATAIIPADSLTYGLIEDIRNWYATDPKDWHIARSQLAAKYGYEKYGGNCHIIPNHGLIILSLLYGNGDFSHSQTIVNTCGWDTDCNAGNVGCILGVRNGLAAFENDIDWRGPVADQLFIPTADGGRAISDALLETDHILDIAYALKDEVRTPPKSGARFHFSLPGSVQGFRPQGNLNLENSLHPKGNTRVLGMEYQLNPGESVNALSPTFIPPEAIEMPGYDLLASPTIYPGQTVRARLLADILNMRSVEAGILLQSYGVSNKLNTTYGPIIQLSPGDATELEWQIPELGGQPIVKIGVLIQSSKAAEGVAYLDYLTWDGVPQVKFCRPAESGSMWKRQWVDAVDGFEDEFGEAFRVIQNRGRGLAITGTREWTDYTVQATLTPHLVKAFGLAARVQGLERYYALMLSEHNKLKLVKCLDGERVLSAIEMEWEFGQPYDFRLVVHGREIRAWVDGEFVINVEDPDLSLCSGGVAVVCEEGRLGTDAISVRDVGS